MKLTGNIHYPLLMTRLDSKGQRSRSQQVVEVAKASTSTLGRRSPFFWFKKNNFYCMPMFFSCIYFLLQTNKNIVTAVLLLRHCLEFQTQ